MLAEFFPDSRAPMSNSFHCSMVRRMISAYWEWLRNENIDLELGQRTLQLEKIVDSVVTLDDREVMILRWLCPEFPFHYSPHEMCAHDKRNWSLDKVSPERNPISNCGV
jgi:hypothetical protein